MENKCSISLGGTKILLALFAQNKFFGQIHFKSILWHSQSFQKILLTTKNGKPVNKKTESFFTYSFMFWNGK